MDKMDKMKELFTALNDKPISYRRIYTKITGKISRGVLLSQLVYWATTCNYKEFYKTNDDIAKETGLSLNELKSAKKKLVALKFISIELKSLPRKTYYTINIDYIMEYIVKYVIGVNSNHPVGDNSTNCMGVISPTTSENTSENTTENTNNINCLNTYNKNDFPLEMLTDKNIPKHARDVINLYFKIYKRIIKNTHPFLKKEKIVEVANIILKKSFDLDLDELDMWEEVMYEYFRLFNKRSDIDCNILHFVTGDTIKIIINRIQ